MKSKKGILIVMASLFISGLVATGNGLLMLPLETSVCQEISLTALPVNCRTPAYDILIGSILLGLGLILAVVVYLRRRANRGPVAT